MDVPRREWNEADFESPLTPGEKALRDRFVAEYLIDYDELKACLRMGFKIQAAAHYARQFISEPYTISLITKEQNRRNHDPLAQVESDRARAMHRMREIVNTGSAAESISASKQLMALHGVVETVKLQQEVTGKDGGPVEVAAIDPSVLSTETIRELLAARKKAEEIKDETLH